MPQALPSLNPNLRCCKPYPVYLFNLQLWSWRFWDIAGYVFWMGDLNFRLLEEYDKTPEEIERSIIKKETKKLFQYDQLRAVMKKGEAFSELTEEDPDFPPTFKFEVGCNSYDYKRRPAWCDRILYCVNSNNYENVTLKVEQLSYKSHPAYVLSDHKPVSAEFIIKVGTRKTRNDSNSNKKYNMYLGTEVLFMTHVVYLPRPEASATKLHMNHKKLNFSALIPKVQLKVGKLPRSVDQVFSDYSETVVEFDKITVWEEGEDNKARFKIAQEIHESNEDWIGLFKENFGSLDDYIMYEYIHKCATPLHDSKQGPPAMERPKKFEIIFSELPSRCKDKYCLIYFSQTEDKVISVLGISNSFPIVKKDSD